MEWYHMCVTVWFWQTGTQTRRENMKKNEKQAYWHSDPNEKRKAALTHIKPTRRRIGMMFCPPASSRAHVTLIQSFSFNFKSLADFRNPHWVHWKSPALLLSSALPPFVFFFFIPPFIFYVISLFLPLISSCRNLRVVCGSYHSVAPSACRSIRPSARLPLPRSQLVFFLFCFGFFCLSGTVLMTDQSSVLIKNTIWSYRWKYKSLIQEQHLCTLWLLIICVLFFFLHEKSDLQFGDFFYCICPPNICFLLVMGDKKQWKNSRKREEGIQKEGKRRKKR